MPFAWLQGGFVSRLISRRSTTMRRWRSTLEHAARWCVPTTYFSLPLTIRTCSASYRRKWCCSAAWASTWTMAVCAHVATSSLNRPRSAKIALSRCHQQQVALTEICVPNNRWHHLTWRSRLLSFVRVVNYWWHHLTKLVSKMSPLLMAGSAAP